MPINAGIEYFKAQNEYGKAKTREEKIKALEEMIRTAPKHKGAENLLMNLKTKLKKLKEKPTAKTARKITTIPKEGDVMICMIGLTQSGKSTLLATMTNARPRISEIQFTTKKPVVGMAEWKGVKLQIVEIPSKFKPVHMSIVRNADGILFVYDSKKDLKEQKNELDELIEKSRITKPSINVLGKKDDVNFDDIYQKIWDKLDYIKIYTKEPGKNPQTRAMVLKKGSTVKDAANRLHKDFVDFFKFAKVWGKSAVHDGEKVGFEHVLADDDIVEIRIA